MRATTVFLSLGALLLARPVLAQCPDGTSGSVLINELQVGPGAAAFIELIGTPGAAIDCLKIVGTNGGDGADCNVYATLELPAGAVLGEDGLYLIAVGGDADLISAKADLQNGPDAVSIVHKDSGAVLDTVAYGGALDGCETPVVEGGMPADAPENGQSIGRADGVDTNVNGKDFQPCNKPTPGLPNDCPAPIPCGAEPSGTLQLSELYVASGEEFVELTGTPGLDLGCFELVQLNGGTGGDECEPTAHSLGGRVLDANGLAVINLDLQVGPDAVRIVWNADDGTVVPIDGVAYGAVLPACPDAGHGGAAPVPKDQSISKCGTAGDDAADWVLTTPTPGVANVCPAPCGASATAVVINEVVYDPDDAAFVELRGPAGLDLSCYTLVEINGGTGGAGCTVGKTVPFSGVVIPEDGYLLIAKGDLAGADLVASFAFQNGPDMFRLLFAADSGPIVVDQLAYNGAVTGCSPAGPDTGAGPKADKGQSVARCPDGTDSGDLAADLKPASPTPGAANDCSGAGGGDGKTCSKPDVAPKISEVQLSAAADAYIELWGAPGTDLSCFAVVAYNGGQAATGCDEYARIELTDAKIPASGYLLIAKEGSTNADAADLTSSKADLQDGPDAVVLVYAGGEKDEIVDSLVYGADLPACAALGIGEGAAAAKPAKGRTLTRCEGYDSNDNSKDFAVCKTPSPGAITTCGCTEGEPAPPGGTTKTSSGGDSGCNAAPAVPGGALLLLLLGLAGLRRRA